MKSERDGHRMNARASAPTFPPDVEGRSPLPSHADSSHITRRRASSAPAHEVNLDEIELFDEAPPPAPAPAPVQPSVPPPLPAPAPVRARLASKAPFHVPIAAETSGRRSSLPIVVACALFAIALGTVAGLLVYPRETRRPAPAPTAPTSLAATPPTSLAAPPSPETTPPAPAVPVVDVAKLPRPTVGTVTGSPGHRLWIDGTLAASWQASVACGPHLVQVGSAGVPRTVEVPCGDGINVSP